MEEIIINDVEDGDVIRNYGIYLEYKEKERFISLSTSYHTNQEILDLDNIEFLDNCEDLTEKDKQKIKDWLWDNPQSWSDN